MKQYIGINNVLMVNCRKYSKNRATDWRFGSKKFDILSLLFSGFKENYAEIWRKE